MTVRAATQPRDTILFVSNGYGEDTIASSIVSQLLPRAAGYRVMAMPLVGEGRAYNQPGVELVGPRELLPSGGLILARWANILHDLRAGLWRVTSHQMSVLRRLSGRLGALVAVGDTYPVLMGGLFGRQRVIFVGTAKSNYFCPYSLMERFIFRRYCDVVFARDEPTAETLRRHHIPARWVGNAMMDSIGVSGQALPLPAGVPRLGLLPGSRQTAYRDLPVMLDAVRYLSQAQSLGYMMALSDSLSLTELAESARASGWTFRAAAGEQSGVEGWLSRDGAEILLLRGRFGDVLAECTLIIGQAGTGNEQAAGAGKPIISFDSDGRRVPGWYRARQKGLLGDSLSIVERSGEAIAREAQAVMQDSQRYAAMQQAGYARMGPPGASDKIASYIVEHVQRSTRQVPCAYVAASLP